MLRSGYLRWATWKAGLTQDKLPQTTFLRPLLVLPDREQLRTTLGDSGLALLQKEAVEISSGWARLFGGKPQPLKLTSSKSLQDWTAYELGKSNPLPSNVADIKLLWEPARFGWAFTLGRAYYLTGDESYAQCFWDYTNTFLDSNPPYLGPNWMSAQEAALRLMALVFSAQVFSTSPHSTIENLQRLAKAVAQHASRIPPSLAYGLAQNNNHVLSEAAALYTAGLALPTHPASKRWRSLGWSLLVRGFQSQISIDGVYTQHSTNYHRLLLQLALWVNAVSQPENMMQASTHQRLAAATRWLLAMLNSQTGAVPNLGPNDGAYIFPLSTNPFADFRPVLQAAGTVFLEQRPLPPGTWDEMSLWFGHSTQQALRMNAEEVSDISDSSLQPADNPSISPLIIRNPNSESHAYLRAAQFRSRPGHADQLHLDLWWRGLNLAQDAGSFLYNAAPPWDNSLSGTNTHNTLMVNHLNQMTRASRFLWLDWAQAEWSAPERADDGAWERIIAQHDGYRRLGLVHQRSVTAYRDGRWLVEDTLKLAGNAKQTKGSALDNVSLHWLLPDWHWEILEASVTSIELRLLSPHGWISLLINTLFDSPESTLDSLPSNYKLIRAGELLSGSGEGEICMGWVSPTYAHKVPALSLTVIATGKPPLTFTSEWRLPANTHDQELQSPFIKH